MRSLFRSIFRRHPQLEQPGPAVRPLDGRTDALAIPTPTDLLGRPVVNLDTPELQRFLAGKRVLVTGAGGSIGSEICRQAMRFCPQKMLLVERCENALFEIDRELRETWIGAEIIPFLADVCEKSRIEQIFRDERPQVVFHCAAHKHVPMMEANPCEAIKNNVFGTKTVADAAGEFAAQSFVLVSTDKAVNPTSVMGATKRVAELYVQSKSRHEGTNRQEGTSRHEGARARRHEGESDDTASFVQSCLRGPLPSSPTRFAAVRFGNVLGSSGSVVPIFQRQIAAGGPVTVTHPEMQRFFMTIPEASQLVMQAGAIGKGGEVFVLEMGSQVKILDLARELIRRHGLEPDRDIQIRFSGIRPGEKLYEELARDDERTARTSHEKIRVWHLPPADPAEVERGLEVLAGSVDSPDKAVAALAACVPEYQPVGRTVSRPAAEQTPVLRLVASTNDANEQAAVEAA
uniref:UDP-N-acetylglucosamine 4,6-dehydratase family protein n=1 Tax=Humisphaera borealis TaxID=2807512 RepID=UPI0019D2322E|nr:nucleoside-diphosphate sugar epimerase/dehydratase [Humisphaera borealis]